MFQDVLICEIVDEISIVLYSGNVVRRSQFARLSAVFALTQIALGVSVSPSYAWSAKAERAVAMVAWERMTPAAHRRYSALFAGSGRILTAKEFAQHLVIKDAEWKYVNERAWRFIDLDVDDPGSGLPMSALIVRGCHGTFGYLDDSAPIVDVRNSKLPATKSHTDGCLERKYLDFSNEITLENIDNDERKNDLRFVATLVMDMHDPLNVSQRMDVHGTCRYVVGGGPHKDVASLEHFLNVTVVDRISKSDVGLAKILGSDITDKEVADATPEGGDPPFSSNTISKYWIGESYSASIKVVYGRGVPGGCNTPETATSIDQSYSENIRAMAVAQLRRSAISLAWLLNKTQWPGEKV